MKGYDELVREAAGRIREILPWDLAKLIDSKDVFLLDVREPSEFCRFHIPGSVNVPRGVLEQACEWDYEETVPSLAQRREMEIVVICRSGKRSLLAAERMMEMGFSNVSSLMTGVKGWNDFEQLLVDNEGNPVDTDSADEMLIPKLRPDQRRP
jgi:rhodanese-related sulfurtransferase